LIDQQRYDEAAPLLDDGLALVTSTADVRQDAAVIRLSYQLARVHVARGDAAAAELLLRDVLTRQQTTLPADDWLIAATRSALGAALIEREQLDEAERLLTEASAVLQDVPGRQGREAAANRERLAALAQARRR
jgi:ATP/maltotriose-dependent transcriptional regulator MalT